MVGFALAAGGDGPAPVRRSAPGGRRARVRSAGVMGSVSWPGRGARATSPASRAHWGVMRPGGPGWGRWVLRGAVEAVDPSPRGVRRLSRPGAVGPGGGAGCGRGARCRPWVVGLQGLWRRGSRRPGIARAPAGRGGGWAPAGARGRAVVGRAGAGGAPRACRAPLSKTSMAAWSATPARPMAAILSARADRTAAPVPSAPGAARTSRARARTRSGRRLGPASRTARPGLEHRRGPLLQRAPAQDVERLAPDALLGAERRHRPAGRVIGPSGDRQTDTGINTAVLIGAHPSIPNHECHHQDPPNRHRCPDTEPSPMP